MEHDTRRELRQSDGAGSPVARVPPAGVARRALDGRRRCRPADALALQRAVGNRAAARLLQRYFVGDYYWSDWRQADDNSMATQIGHPNHELYAKPGKAAQANQQLRAANSKIQLLETKVTDTFHSANGSAVLHKIEAWNTANGTAGDTMLLWADCGRCASLVSGAEDPGLERHAVYSDEGVRTEAEGNPTAMKTAIMKGWLTKEGNRKSVLAARPGEEGAKHEADMQAIFAALEAGAAREAELEPLAERKAAATTEEELEAINAAIRNKADEAARAYWSYYNGLPEDERERIDAALKINRHADATVGQGFTMSTGGKDIGGKNRWNFHWGGVVMTSDDNHDKVVLENYSTSDWDEQNTRWTFEMYGTKNPDQTFHEQHKATGQHGETPTTMTFEKTKQP
jgi:hypothetical protein